MTENKDIAPEQVWETLREPEQEVCVYFAVSDWKTGVGGDYLQAMGAGEEVVGELVKRGLVDKRPTWQFFQEQADLRKAKAEEIRERMHKDILSGLNDDERTLLNDYDRYKSVADRKNEEPRFRLMQEKFHNWINTTFSE